MTETQQAETTLIWHDILELGLEGCGWGREQLCHPYDRLPAHAKDKVPPRVWDLAQQSAGLMVRFQTDAPAIHVRWKLRTDILAMEHMPATGVSGVDLYAQHQGQWQWASIGRPKAVENQATLIAELEPTTRHYQLLLPLYNGVEAVAIGIPAGSTITAAPQWPQPRPICMYGTSILQGACASRPGMAHSHILSRRLNRPVINLGFSGSARSEPALAELLAELDPAAFVLEPLPNMNAELIDERIEPFVQTIRQARPSTPILLVGSIEYADSWIKAARRARSQSSNQQLQAAFERLQQAGVKHLFHVSGEALYGHDTEATVDGTHATDLGFMRMADVLEPALRQVL